MRAKSQSAVRTFRDGNNVPLLYLQMRQGFFREHNTKGIPNFADFEFKRHASLYPQMLLRQTH